MKRVEKRPHVSAIAEETHAVLHLVDLLSAIRKAVQALSLVGELGDVFSIKTSKKKASYSSFKASGH